MPPISGTARRTDGARFGVPRLATARLLLREPRMGDFEGFAANAADPLARQYIGGPLGRREAWQRFTGMAGHWMLSGLGWWMVEEPALGPIGTVGVFIRETGPELEIGWSIDRRHWGHGYATEAARAALEFASSERRGERIIAYVGVENAASLGVATRIGMKREAQVDFYDAKHWLYAFAR